MDLLKKVKSKLTNLGFLALLKFGVLIKSPKLTVRALVFFTVKFNDSAGKKVLCLGRSIFLDDLRAMADKSGQIQYFIIHLTYFKILFDRFVSPAERRKITEANYHEEKFGQAGKKGYLEFLIKLLPELKKSIGFEAVLSGNFGYVMQQEVERACQQLEIPFVIMHKEGLGAYGDYVDMNLYDGYIFRGQKMLLYNNQIKKALLENIGGLTEEKVEVVGIPRFDYYLSDSSAGVIPGQVVFFSFYYEDRFFNLIQGEKRVKEARARCYNFHKLIMEFAEKNPKLKVIIKTKASEHFSRYVNEIFDQNFKKPIANLEITNLGNPVELVKKSIAVIGFNSTVSLEAIAAKKTLISPIFNDLVENKSWNFFEKFPELVNYAGTVEDLEKYVYNYRDYLKYDERVRDEFLKDFIYSADGRAGRRAEEAIIKLME